MRCRRMERVVSHCYAWQPPGRLAQLGERRLDKAEVTGSSPVSPTFENRTTARFRGSRGGPGGQARRQLLDVRPDKPTRGAGLTPGPTAAVREHVTHGPQ